MLRIVFLSLILSNAVLLSEDKHFVIDICSYNNKKWYKQNLDSVFSQEYTNYRVIYTDDCSSDDTGKLVEKYVKEQNQEHRVTVKKNSIRQRMLANHWRVIHECNDDEIIIHLDGDDCFASSQVLTILNDVYQDENVWMTYGSYKFWPKNERYELEEIPSRVVKRNDYRKANFRKSPYHPRTFYAWLAKRIRLEDLLYPHYPFKGQFIPAISDWSLLYPLFEMAAGRYRLISDTLYSFNVVNPLNHDKDKKTVRLQQQCGSYICRKKPYAPLQSRPAITQNSQELVDVVVLNTRGSMHAYGEKLKGHGKIYSQDEEIDFNLLTDYVCCIDCDFQLPNIDLVECKKLLEKTDAKAFFFFLEQLPSYSVWLENSFYAFQSKFLPRLKSKSFMCKKDTFIKLLQDGPVVFNFTGPEEVGLFFKVHKTE